MNRERVLLTKQIDWESVESELADCYCMGNGRPSVPFRKSYGFSHNIINE